MKSEAEFCTIIKNSLTIGFKIPDPTGNFSFTIERLFDGIGAFQGKPVYFEAKFLPELKAFNLQIIMDHQIAGLYSFKKALPNSLCWIILGIKVGHGDNRVFIFDDIDMIIKRRNNKENFLKKELEILPYFQIRKELIDLTNYQEGLIK